MSKDILFWDKTGKPYTPSSITEKLYEVGVNKGDILFIHTDIMFGKLNPSLGRKSYLQSLYQILLDIKADTLFFPAFTYSFCNHENYDVLNSKTSMGALIEFIRRQPGAYRSLDPILSIVAIGNNNIILCDPIADNSLGVDSGFDRLHRLNNVKFLFFGADIGDCFTYLHYIEKVLDVPYRYDQLFEGYVIDYNGIRKFCKQAIHTMCSGIEYRDFSFQKNVLIREGLLRVTNIGDLELGCISEHDVYNYFCDLIKKDLFSLVKPFKREELRKEYQYGKNGERVTHC